LFCSAAAFSRFVEQKEEESKESCAREAVERTAAMASALPGAPGSGLKIACLGAGYVGGPTMVGLRPARAALRSPRPTRVLLPPRFFFFRRR
jgi:hypothetical protein